MGPRVVRIPVSGVRQTYTWWPMRNCHTAGEKSPVCLVRGVQTDCHETMIWMARRQHVPGRWVLLWN